MSAEVKIFESPQKLGAGFAAEFASVVNEYTSHKEKINIAISGGNTPKLFFNSLTTEYKNKIDWNYVYIYWADERCVSPEDNESNYKMIKEFLLDKITIKSNNINRIKGEANPAEEAGRYSALVKAQLPDVNSLPQFDIMLLGLGSDGHTASIFPGHLDLFDSEKTCEVAFHPVSGQTRITITGPVINNAGTVAFLVTGKKKAPIVEKLFKKDPDALNYPASRTVPVFGQLNWLIDRDAAMNLEG